MSNKNSSLPVLLIVLVIVIIAAGALWWIMTQSTTPSAVSATIATSTSVKNTSPVTGSSTGSNSTPSITITNISGRSVTVTYAGLKTVDGGWVAPPTSLLVQNVGISKPILEIPMDGAASGKITFVLPAGTETGQYGVTPVGIATSPSAPCPVGDCSTSYGDANNYVSAKFYVLLDGTIAANPVITATIDQSSLSTTSGSPTITGTAHIPFANDLSIQMTQLTPVASGTPAEWTQSATINNGKWSATFSPDREFAGTHTSVPPGSYQIEVYAASANLPPIAKGTLVVN